VFRHEVIGVSKAEEIALAMQSKGRIHKEVEVQTGVTKSRLEKLRTPMVHVNRVLITGMLAEAYEVAESANEIVNVARELGKLHGLYEPEKTVTLNVDSGDITKQLQQMSTEDLMRLLGQDKDAIVIEGAVDADR